MTGRSSSTSRPHGRGRYGTVCSASPLWRSTRTGPSAANSHT